MCVCSGQVWTAAAWSGTMPFRCFLSQYYTWSILTARTGTGELRQGITSVVMMASIRNTKFKFGFCLPKLQLNYEVRHSGRLLINLDHLGISCTKKFFFLFLPSTENDCSSLNRNCDLAQQLSHCGRSTPIGGGPLCKPTWGHTFREIFKSNEIAIWQGCGHNQDTIYISTI